MHKKENQKAIERKEQRVKNGNREVSRVKMFVFDAITIALLLGFDQWTKYLTILRLKGKPAFVLIDGVLELQYLENRGSAFGMLQDQKYFILFMDIVFMAGVLVAVLFEVQKLQVALLKYKQIQNKETD